jgi:hypothetical protein
MTDEQQLEQTRARRFGWANLLVWATLGFVLEAAHGLKLPLYVDDELARMLLRLGHAHGVGLSLVVLLYGVSAVPVMPLSPGRASLSGRLLRAAAWLMPLGFTLSAFGHPEGDPSPLIFLVPAGALSLLTGLGLTTRSVWHRD